MRINGSVVSCTLTLFQVAIRALGFEVKKTDVLKILKDYDKDGKGKITFQDFNEISEYNNSLFLSLSLSHTHTLFLIAL